MLICVTLCLISLVNEIRGQNDYEYEDEPAAAAPKKPPPRGLSSLNRSARGPIIGRPQPKSQVASKSTTTTEAPAPAVYDDEPVDEDLPAEEQPTTTTEAPKKFIKGGVVRPFRSNTDLIETLKRRRQQASQHGTVVSATTSTAAPTTEKQFKNNGRRNNSNKVIDQAGSDSNRKTATANAASGNKRFSPKSRQNTEPAEEEPIQEEAQPTRASRLFGRSRKF